MSTNSRLIRKNKFPKRKIEENKDRIELQSDIIYLESLKFELENSKKYDRLQKLIHKKQGWRAYTC